MRIVFFLSFFVLWLMGQESLSCEFIEAHKKDFFEKKLDFSDVNLFRVLESCENSLKNQNATAKLYKLANQIRGSDSACVGISYLPKLTEFNALLLQIALNPTSYQKNLANSKTQEKKYDILKSYFRYWAYQSIGNFRLYQEFWREYNQAIEPLEQYFQANFKFDKASNIYYTTNALNEFLNWAVGDTRIQKDISTFSKFVANKNNDIARIQDFIYANNPSENELTIALHSALLNQREKEVIELLVNFGARIDEGYESAIFYALENYENTKFLLDNGANVNSANAFGKTPIFYAIEFGRKDIVSLLLQNGANINQKYINNNEKLALSANIGADTPYFITLCALEHTSKNVLMDAAAYADIEILKTLISKGAKLNEVDDLGFNALDFALAAGKKENAAYLKSLGLKANEYLYHGGSLE